MATKIDPWFIDQLVLLLEIATMIKSAPELNVDLLRTAKRHGFSDAQIAGLRHLSEDVVRGVRWALGVRPVYKTVDTCAAEFAARTPYHYSCYDLETEVAPRQKPAVLILGSGPNRIGQGIEFDYSCVHAAMSLSAAGYETIMVNCNPETVSTDYDTADRLYFEPLTLEDVLEVVHAEQAAGPVAGIIVQLGGQTPLRLAQALKDAGVPIVGTSPEAIHLAEERGAFGRVLAEANLPAPKHGLARSFAEAKSIADEIGYPVLVRPSVLGGRGMEIVYDESTLSAYIERATEVSPAHPVLVDHFLDDAVEIDVDALRRHGSLPWRRHGAHRGGRYPLRRLSLRTSADHSRCRGRGPDSFLDRGDRPGRRGMWLDQHPVCDGRRHAVRPGGQPTRLTYGALRLQGDRDPARQGGRSRHAGCERAAVAGGGAAASDRRRLHGELLVTDRGQRGGDAFQPLPHR